jgi:hypothetical protein
MDANGENGFFARTAVQPSRSGLSAIIVASAAIAILWMWLAVAALMEGGVSNWIIFPVAMVGIAVFGWIAWWSARRRANPEPAIILDEVGVYDNVSMAKAGRVKWRSMERVWVIGPTWMPFLCILPEDVEPYVREQDDVRNVLMRFNRATFGAPVVIPLAVVDMPTADVWNRVIQLAGTSRAPVASSNLAAGA